MERVTPSTVASTPDVPDLGAKDRKSTSPGARSPRSRKHTASPTILAGRPTQTSPSPTPDGKVWTLPGKPQPLSQGSAALTGALWKGISGGPKAQRTSSKSQARRTMKKQTVHDLDGALGNTAKSEQLRLAASLHAGGADGEAWGIQHRRELRAKRAQQLWREPSERVGRCDRSLVWSACDTFWSFDKSRSGEITRDKYIARLADTHSVTVLRMLRKSGLEARFRRSAQPVRIDEFLRLIWPAVTPQDFEVVKRWKQLREAWKLLHDRRFHGSEWELNRVFNLLSEELELTDDVEEGAMHIHVKIKAAIESNTVARKLALFPILNTVQSRHHSLLPTCSSAHITMQGETYALTAGSVAVKGDFEGYSGRKAVWEFLEGRGPGGEKYERFTVILILVNVLAFIVGTSFDKTYNVDPATGKYIGLECEWCDVAFFGNELDNGMSGTSLLEAFTAMCFTIDWCVRYWACIESDEYPSRLDYAMSFFSIIDLLSTLPFYFGFVLPVNLVATQFLRMFRLFRMMRVEGRYAKAFTLFDDVVAAKRNVMITAGFVGGVVWVIMAGFYFVVNRSKKEMIYCPRCPEVEVSKCTIDEYGFVDCAAGGCAAPNECWNLFESIPSSMFQTLLNLFGEFPLSDRQQGWGMVISAFAAMVAQVVFGIPCGIIGSGFEEQMDKMEEEAGGDTSGTPPADYGSTRGALIGAPTDEVSNETFRGRVYNFLHGKTEEGKAFQYLIVGLIVTSTLSFMLETLQHVQDNAALNGFLFGLEAFTVAVFTSEYLLGVYSIGMDPVFDGWYGLWAHLTSFNQLVDLLAILPYFIGLLFGIQGGSGLLCVRALRLIRIVKTDTFVNAFSVLEAVVVSRADILIITGFAALVFWVFFASMMYYLERGNPDAEMAAYYTTIPTAMWMTLLNLSGECPLCMYTTQGKILLSIIGIFAVGFISVPIGALASGFQEFQEQRAEDTPDVEPEESQESLGGTHKHTIRAFLDGETSAGTWFNRLLLLLIFSTVVLAIIETVPGMDCQKSGVTSQSGMCNSFNLFEAFSVAMFTLEYLLGLYSAPSRLDFILSFYSLIDILAIMPWYLSVAMPGGWVDQNNTLFLMFRVLRLLRLDKEVPSLTLIDDVFRLKRNMLLVTGVIAGIVWVIFSSLMYLAESQDFSTGIDPVPLYGCSGSNCTQSIRYSNFFSASGYINIHLTGDYPIIDYSTWGRAVCFLMIVFGVGIVSIPSGLIADGFKTVVDKRQGEETLLRDYDIRYRELADAPPPREFSSELLNSLQDDLNTLLNGELVAGKVHRSLASDMLNKTILVAIILNVACVLLESCPEINRTIGNQPGNLFDVLELLCVMLFSFEYAARLFSVTKDKEHLYSRWCYVTTFFGVVDLVTIAPFYVQLAMQIAGSDIDQDAADAFRLVRLFRLLELEHFITAFTVLDNVFWRSRGALFATGILALCIWLVTTTLFYIVELDNPNWCVEWATPSCGTKWRPDCVCTTKSTFDTMPHALYFMSLIVFAGEWPIIDFTIVGKLLCFVTCIISIGLAALPIGSLFDSFSNVLEAEGDLDKAMEEEADEDEDQARKAEEGVGAAAAATKLLAK